MDFVVDCHFFSDIFWFVRIKLKLSVDSCVNIFSYQFFSLTVLPYNSVTAGQLKQTWIQMACNIYGNLWDVDSQHDTHQCFCLGIFIIYYFIYSSFISQRIIGTVR